MEIDRIKEIAESLATESYYKFNLMCTLKEHPEFLPQLEALIIQCKKSRKTS